MSVEKAEEPTVRRSDIEYIERRIESAFEDRQKIKKMLKIVVAILVDKKLIGEAVAKTFMESKTIEEVEKKVKETVKDEAKEKKILEWFMEAKKLWIAGAIKKKGALRAQLGIKEGETIPPSILQRIVKAETGTSISFRGKSIKVTTQLKRRALLAIKLRKMPKRGRK